MRKLSAVLVGVVVPAIALATASCGKDDPPPQSPQPMYGQPCQPGQPCNNAPPQYGQPGAQPGQPGQPGAMPGQPAPGQMNTPGPSALPCQNDSQCMTHHCNTQHGKCAFPCASDADCIQGTTCLGPGQPMAFCAPKPPGT
jgi:hypothetical protein